MPCEPRSVTGSKHAPLLQQGKVSYSVIVKRCRRMGNLLEASSSCATQDEGAGGWHELKDAHMLLHLCCSHDVLCMPCVKLCGWQTAHCMTGPTDGQRCLLNAVAMLNMLRLSFPPEPLFPTFIDNSIHRKCSYKRDTTQCHRRQVSGCGST